LGISARGFCVTWFTDAKWRVQLFGADGCQYETLMEPNFGACAALRDILSAALRSLGFRRVHGDETIPPFDETIFLTARMRRETEMGYGRTGGGWSGPWVTSQLHFSSGK
jgi:hypothetical protein